MQDIIQIPTHQQNGLYDITLQVKETVSRCSVQNGIVSVYVRIATAAIMLQFNILAPNSPINFTRSGSYT